jgi:hypothetical protein
MIPSLAAVRQACALVDKAHDGDLPDSVHRSLVNQAVVNPVRLAEVVLALAGMVAASRPPELPRNEESYEKYLQRAHAAHARGERLEWVLTGEREYQRLRKERKRQEQKGAA